MCLSKQMAMYNSLSARLIKIKNRMRSQRRRRKRAKRLREQKKSIRRIFLGFVGITGIVLIWSGISRFATDNLDLSESIAIGIGLLFVSGLLTKRFVRTFA